jgi:phosphopantetheinyl transferase
MSMTVCGVGEKMVASVPSDRLADRLSGRIALRQAYRDFCEARSVRPADPAVAYRPNGQPYLAAQPDIYCSISHSHRFGVATVARSPVGIDIERVQPHDPRLSEYVAQVEELAALRELVASATELLAMLWTLKEATAKASGSGLRIPLRRLRVTPVGARRFEVNGWTALSYRYDQFFIGLAFEQSVQGRPSIRWYQPGRLPAAEFAEVAGDTETIPADSIHRAVSG